MSVILHWLILEEDASSGKAIGDVPCRWFLLQKSGFSLATANLLTF
jgi:hypothetical protein